MGLLDLVEEQHRVRPPPHLLGQLAGLLVADVAGRRADEARNRVPLLELAHVEADHQVLVAEQSLGERAGELGLADPGRAKEEEAADGSLRITETRARAPDRLRDRGDRLFLSHDPAVQLLFELHQPLALLGCQLRDGDAGRP